MTKPNQTVPTPETPETPEAAKVQVVDQKAESEFKNNGKDVKIRLGDKDSGKWITVKKGKTVTIPRKIALANGLEEVE